MKTTCAAMIKKVVKPTCSSGIRLGNFPTIQHKLGPKNAFVQLPQQFNTKLESKKTRILYKYNELCIHKLGKKFHWSIHPYQFHTKSESQIQEFFTNIMTILKTWGKKGIGNHTYQNIRKIIKVSPKTN